MKKASATIQPPPGPESRPPESSTQPTDDPNEKPYPGYAREVKALQDKVADAERSHAAPLPGPLREAFAGEPRVVHGFTFQPVCAWLLAILTRIDSPLLEIVRVYRERSDELKEIATAKDGKKLLALQKEIAAQIRREIKPGPDSAIETVFCFVTPVEKCQELLDEDRKALTRSARLALGKVHPAILAELERSCGEHYTSSFATALAISPAPQEGGGNGEVFYPPPAEPKTDSAGGSKLSAP